MLFRSRDLLTGTSEADNFLFPTFRTGLPGHRLQSLDELVGYHPEDRIAISTFPDRVQGDSQNTRQITAISGNATELSLQAIRQVVSPGLQPFEATAITVNGYQGCFLVVNDRNQGFNHRAMVVHLSDFVPTLNTPLTFL